VSRRELLRNRGLLGLLLRDIVSLTGSQMTWVALPWFVLTTTGSPTRMAVVLAVEAGSLAIFGFLLGNVVTRLGPRRTMLIADGMRAPLTALIPVLHWADALSFPLLLALIAVISAVVTPSFASKPRCSRTSSARTRPASRRRTRCSRRRSGSRSSSGLRSAVC
jgi:Na+/melibiose symporter-like transporter